MRKVKFIGICLAILVTVKLFSVKNFDSSTNLREKIVSQTRHSIGLIDLPPVIRNARLHVPRLNKDTAFSDDIIHGDLIRHWKDRSKDFLLNRNQTPYNASALMMLKNRGNTSRYVNRPIFMPIKLAYFRNRTKRVTSFGHDFIISSSACSKSNPIVLLVLCVSKYSHGTTRETIRQTWGSVSKTKQWPLSTRKFSDVKVLFVLGRSELDWKQKAYLEEEDRRYGDIIVADFIDSYYNLTRKVTVGLKWAEKYCSGVKFILKVDEDTFIHVDNLVFFLKTLEVPQRGLIIGHVYPKPPVMRNGKWGLNISVYPFSYFPPYVSGNSYVISGNILSKMTNAIEYFPYVFVEDVAITGIVRKAINASLYHDQGFTFFARPAPKLCDFHNDTIKSATKTSDGMKKRIWRALQDTEDKCNLVEKRYKMNTYFGRRTLFGRARER